MTSAEALRAAAAAGPYFVWEPWTAGAGWRLLDELTDPDVAAERVAAARAALLGLTGLAEDDVPERVVASVAFLGLASRLLSPPLAAVALTGLLPVPRPDQIFWKPVPGGPWPIAYAGDPVAGDFVDGIVGGLVTPVLRTFQERFVLSPRVLWGNVASALAGAAGMLGTEAAGELAGRVLAVPPLAGTGTLIRPQASHPRRFLVRNNCCLYYRIPGGGTCGDCVLTPADERSRGWAAALGR